MVFGSRSNAWFIAEAVNRMLDDASRTVFTAFVRECGGEGPRPEDMYEAMFVRLDEVDAAAAEKMFWVDLVFPRKSAMERLAFEAGDDC